MFNSTNKHIVVVLYDGIGNSVFQSQVLAPLLEMINNSSNLEITIVSFEKEQLSAEALRAIPADDKLHVMIFSKLRFFGKPSLYPAVSKLIKMLSKNSCHQIIARGPLAGWVATKALEKMALRDPERLRKESQNPFPSLVIQARGLCADEYRYANMREPKNFFMQLVNKFMYGALHQIELEVYRNKRQTDFPHDVTIEAVSPALKEHLIKNFRAEGAKITIATKDLTKSVDKQQVQAWRTEIRTKLGIPADTYVYCYSGSYKPWQCADQTMAYFADEFKKDHKLFLLVLSQDQDKFSAALKALNLPKDCYRLKQFRW